MDLFDNIEHIGTKPVERELVKRTKMNLKDLDSILSQCIQSNMLDQSISLHEEIVSAVNRIIEHDRDHQHIHETVLRHYDSVMSKHMSWTPTLITLGAFFFGSYLNKSEYGTKNKYCSLMAAMALPNFGDSVRRCQGNVIYMNRKGIAVNVNNSKRVCFVELDNSLSNSLSQEQFDELYDSGCRKIITMKENKMLESKKILPPTSPEKSVDYDAIYQSDEEVEKSFEVVYTKSIPYIDDTSSVDSDDPFSSLVSTKEPKSAKSPKRKVKFVSSTSKISSKATIINKAKTVVNKAKPKQEIKNKHLFLESVPSVSDDLYDGICDDSSDNSSNPEDNLPVIDQDPFAGLGSLPVPHCWNIGFDDGLKKKIIVENSNTDTLDSIVESSTDVCTFFAGSALLIIAIIFLAIVYIGLAIYFQNHPEQWL